jgi:asparagine synthase (glutamine-hydrolysing)
MQRYLAFGWPACDAEAAAQAAAWRTDLAADPRWACALSRPGLEVWCVEGRRLDVEVLEPSGVVIVGDLVTPGGPFGLTKEMPPPAAAHRLAAGAWGRFLALLPDPAGGAPWLYREPSGALEALTWRRGRLGAVADDIDRAPPGFAADGIALDWIAIAQIVRRPLACGHVSPLAGYRPILPGEVRPLGGEAADGTTVWRPSTWAGGGAEADPDRLRSTVLGTVTALAEREPRILLEVSGGLDSAVVAAALVHGGHAARLAGVLNYHAARPEADERSWAGRVCEGLGLPLTPVEKPPAAITLEDLAEFAACAAPAFQAIDAPRDRDTAARAQALGATAIFGGQGGDGVFYQMPTAHLVADYLGAGGRGWRDPFVLDVARWLRRPVWSVLREARRGRTPQAHAFESAPFWGPRARAAADEAAHPWIADARTASPAKQVQIEAILAMQAAWGRSRRGAVAEVLHPLLSQPVLELGLAIPAWRLVEGGRDRAFARRTFAAWLPSEIVARRSKGALTAYYTKRIARSLPFLREHLLDGVLADAGVLDRAAVNRALDVDRLIWTGEGVRLSRAALIEAWARHWQTRLPDAPRGARSAGRF